MVILLLSGNVGYAYTGSKILLVVFKFFATLVKSPLSNFSYKQ